MHTRLLLDRDLEKDDLGEKTVDYYLILRSWRSV